MPTYDIDPKNAKIVKSFEKIAELLPKLVDQAKKDAEKKLQALKSVAKMKTMEGQQSREKTLEKIKKLKEQNQVLRNTKIKRP